VLVIDGSASMQTTDEAGSGGFGMARSGPTCMIIGMSSDGRSRTLVSAGL